MPRKSGLTGVHHLLPDGTWCVRVQAPSLKVGKVITVRLKGGRSWRAPVKRILDSGKGFFYVHTGKRLPPYKPREKRDWSSVPSGVFFE